MANLTSVVRPPRVVILPWWRAWPSRQVLGSTKQALQCANTRPISFCLLLDDIYIGGPLILHLPLVVTDHHNGVLTATFTLQLCVICVAVPIVRVISAHSPCHGAITSPLCAVSEPSSRGSYTPRPYGHYTGGASTSGVLPFWQDEVFSHRRPTLPAATMPTPSG